MIGGGATRPTPPSHASVAHKFEAVADSWGSVSAPAVSRVMGGATKRKKIAKTNNYVKLHLGEGLLEMLSASNTLV